MPVLVSVMVILAPATAAPPASVTLPTIEPVTAWLNASDEPKSRPSTTARNIRRLLFITHLQSDDRFGGTVCYVERSLSRVGRGIELCELVYPSKAACAPGRRRAIGWIKSKLSLY